MALKWKDINFEEHTISITKTYYNPNNQTKECQLVTPKTKSSKRTIVVDERFIAALQEHLETQEKVRKRNSDCYYDASFIFAKTQQELGYPIFTQIIENRMARLLKLAGLNQELTPHSLRHTHTSLLIKAGVELEQIIERLKYSADSIIRNVYLHVTKEMKKEAPHKFTQLMRNL